jgi:diguanylate cyclase
MQTQPAEVEAAVRPRQALLASLESGDDLIIEYVPVVDLRTRRWVQLKAVSSLRHPTHGVLPTSTVEPWLDREGLTPLLGRLLVERASNDLAVLFERHGSRAPSSVSFNVTPLQIQDALFCDDIRRAIARLDLPTGSLCLDIREALVTEPHGAAVTLEALNAVGVALGLDAFGSGRASLAALDSLPFASVKIEPSFVRGVAGDRYRQAIVSSICRVAQALGQAAIADGVCTEADLRALPGLGCHLAMGPAVARALDIGTMHERLRSPLTASLSVH